MTVCDPSLEGHATPSPRTPKLSHAGQVRTRPSTISGSALLCTMSARHVRAGVLSKPGRLDAELAEVRARPARARG
jgi:hypothetical protein